jgi:hypothetical protein
MLFAGTLKYLWTKLILQLFFLHIKTLIVRDMNVRLAMLPSRIMAGTFELFEFLLLSKLPRFVFVCMCLFNSIFDRAYFIIGLLVVLYAHK